MGAHSNPHATTRLPRLSGSGQHRDPWKPPWTPTPRQLTVGVVLVLALALVAATLAVWAGPSPQAAGPVGPFPVQADRGAEPHPHPYPLGPDRLHDSPEPVRRDVVTVSSTQDVPVDDPQPVGDQPERTPTPAPVVPAGQDQPTGQGPVEVVQDDQAAEPVEVEVDPVEVVPEVVPDVVPDVVPEDTDEPAPGGSCQ